MQPRIEFASRSSLGERSTGISIVYSLSLLSVLAGCSGSDAPGTSHGGPTYVRDIQPLVATKCAGCHTDGGIGPFPLETYEQVSAVAGAVATAVADRTMPPWLAGDGCADYLADRSLSTEQIDAVTGWVSAGMPKGDPNATPVEVADERLSLSRVDFELPIPEPYTPQVFPDDYRCFFLDWPATETTHVTGFGVEPGNKAIVHHVIAYVVRPDNLSTFQALDDADPDPGWVCFGGPTGENSSPGQAGWIGGWVPGGIGADFPAGTGIEVPVGSKLVVQMHYNASGASAAPDQTKILLRADAVVEKKAGIMPFADFQWLTPGVMNIPAHMKGVTHSVSTDPTTIVNLLTGGAIASGKPLTVHDVGMHMHTLGKRGLTRLDRADGTSECLLDIPRWDFNWQHSHVFAEPKQVAPGDKLFLECQWDNPGDADVSWGEGTKDEMCLGIYYVTE